MSTARALRTSALLALGLLAQAGCSDLSGAGPTAKDMQDSHAVKIVDVTPASATALRDQVDAANQAAVDRTLAALQSTPVSPAFRFGPGATMDVSLWSLSPLVGQAQTASPSGAPGSALLGTYTVSADGMIILPYAGQVRIGGLTLLQAQKAITQRFASLGIVQRPSVGIEVRTSPQGRILVTGAIGQPKLLPWSPAGMTLADAVTQAFGDGSATLGQSTDLGTNGSAVRVALLRDGEAPAELPMSVALEREIPLRPGDRVVVKRAPAVKVTMLGGGIKKDGIYNFAEPPTLSAVLAQASGLDGNAANDHAVFVLRPRRSGAPVLYDFAWNHLQGLIASQNFEIENGDLVYVAEAPIVPIQRVVATLFEIALPIEAVGAVGGGGL
jgi:polysaccharide export outer membrane protein